MGGELIYNLILHLISFEMVKKIFFVFRYKRFYLLAVLFGVNKYNKHRINILFPMN